MLRWTNASLKWWETEISFQTFLPLSIKSQYSTENSKKFMPAGWQLTDAFCFILFYFWEGGRGEMINFLQSFPVKLCNVFNTGFFLTDSGTARMESLSEVDGQILTWNGSRDEI